MTNPPAVGSMRFLDSATPSLPDGDYTMTVTTTIMTDSDSLPVTDDDPRHLTVVGPRFTLPAAEVSAMYPPDNSSGDCAAVLPHVVLDRQTLPWERSWTAASTPWLAVLLLGPDDLSAGLYTPPSTVTGVRAAVGDVAYAALRTQATTPAERDALDAVSTTAMTVRADLLSAILPTPSDATLQCHVRQVNPADTTLTAGDPDGLFAVVVSNRMPTQPGRHLACLVSLELRTDLPGLAAGQQFVPLLVLHSWSFTAVDTGGTFSGILRDDVAPKAAAIGMSRTTPLQVPYTNPVGVSSTEAYWGPLTAEPPTTTAVDSTSFSARVANQFGRLLAASDEALLRSIANWRSEIQTAAATSEHAAALHADLPSPRPTSKSRTRAAEPAAPPSVAAALAAHGARYLSAAEGTPGAEPWGVPATVVALHTPEARAATPRSQAETEPAPPPSFTVAVRPPVRQIVDPLPRRPASVWPPRVNALAPTGDGATPGERTLRRRLGALAAAPESTRSHTVGPPATFSADVPARVLSFRDDILALRRIPLAQFLPSPDLLPDESMRFFYLDPDWLDQLLAGACSVGAAGTNAQQHTEVMTRGLTTTTTPGLPAAPRITTGFLLRSRLVTGWPQLVVRAFATAPDPDADPATEAAMPPLRAERISPSILLMLYAGFPRAVWVEEPSHSIRHGVEIGGTTGYHLIPGLAARHPLPQVPVPMRATTNGSAPSVVDVTGLAAVGGGWSPGTLAMQLLREPYRHIFTLG